ncbi:hypothetical protein C8J56DRAFT_1052616 [Mycena floridula]|nr:hypothetical protein C8J56DRAFT_1052616 [Mycena floridula]
MGLEASRSQISSLRKRAYKSSPGYSKSVHARCRPYTSLANELMLVITQTSSTPGVIVILHGGLSRQIDNARIVQEMDCSSNSSSILFATADTSALDVTRKSFVLAGETRTAIWFRDQDAALLKRREPLRVRVVDEHAMALNSSLPWPTDI